MVRLLSWEAIITSNLWITNSKLNRISVMTRTKTWITIKTGVICSNSIKMATKTQICKICRWTRICSQPSTRWGKKLRLTIPWLKQMAPRKDLTTRKISATSTPRQMQMVMLRQVSKPMLKTKDTISTNLQGPRTSKLKRHSEPTSKNPKLGSK